MIFGDSQFETPFVSTLSSQSTDPSPTSAKSRDDQPMYPVTVKQIAESTPSHGSNYLIDGVDVYNVKLVGMVFNKLERKTDVAFLIDDGTGRIACNRWLNDSQDAKEVEYLTDGRHVRIHGHLKNFQGKKQIVVYAIRPVTDYNEIANHFLECIHAHCVHTKLLASGNKQDGFAISSPSPNVTTPSGNQAVSSSQFSQEKKLDGPRDIDMMVLDYLRLPSNSALDHGLHRDEIAQKLQVPKERIMQAMINLGSDGHVYETIDEFHFKAAD